MNNELLAVLDYLERDRGIDRDVLTKVIEEALISAAKRAIGPANDLRVNLDPKTGDIQAIAKLEVVQHLDYPEKQIALADARMKVAEAKIGDLIDWEVTPKNFGRIVAQTAKQGIMQRLRQAEKGRIREEFADQIGQVLYGAVTRFERGEVIINFGRADGVLRPHDRVPKEDYQVGDHVSCVLTEVNMNRTGPILIVSRSSPDLVRGLFQREVAEISEGIVEIKAVAREPGFRSKIAVYSKEQNVDPVGACVGIRGSRVKTIVRELNGEKVDIVRWDANVSTFVANALQPAAIKSMEIDEQLHKVRILVDSEQLSLAIGKRGQNARLTAKLTGWAVDIRQSEDSKEVDFQGKVRQAIAQLATLPGITTEIAEKLVNNGFLSVDGLRAADVADLAGIDGIGTEIAERIMEAVRQIPAE